MTKENGIVLTKEAIANEGIEIKLTQSDVIDALVEEQVGTITATVEKLYLRAEELFAKMKLEWDEYIDSLVASVPVPKGLTVTGRYCEHIGANTNGQIFYVKEESTGNSNIKYKSSYKSYTVAAKGSISINYKGTIAGVELKGNAPGPDYDFKHSKKLVDAIEKHNKEVGDFLVLMPEKGFNEKEIARKIKNQFTKEILRSSSAEFRAKLKEGFGLNL